MNRTYFKILELARWALDHRHPGKLGWAVKRLQRLSSAGYRLGMAACQALNDGPLDDGANMKSLDKFRGYIDAELSRLEAIAAAEAEKAQQRARQLKDIDSDIAFLKDTIQNIRNEAEDTTPVSAAGRLLQKASKLEAGELAAAIKEREEFLKGGKNA